MELVPGSNATVPSQELSIEIQSSASVDASSFRLYEDGKVKGDLDMCFYGQPINDDQTIRLESQGNTARFIVNLPKLSANVQKIAFTVTCDQGSLISGLNLLSIDVKQQGTPILKGTVDTSGRKEAALILGELYRRNNEWKFRFVSQGFNGGLQPLAEHFGVVIDTPAPATAPPVERPASQPSTPQPSTPPSSPGQSSINLSKVSLTKESPSISLEKKEDFGQIKINLNWHRETEKPQGFLKGLFANKGIDLDLAAFIRLKNGEQGVIQALGNSFGFYARAPYVQLQGDDRTGDNTSGEWIHINGKFWKEIDEVLIYTFIYQGVASWDKTDGVVTIDVPNQPPIETRLTEGNNQMLCAIGRLVNENGSIKVERINQYFKDQVEMDKAFGWGFRWGSGSK